VLITRVAKDALEKAIEEHEGGASEDLGLQLQETGVIRMPDVSSGTPEPRHWWFSAISNEDEPP